MAPQAIQGWGFYQNHPGPGWKNGKIKQLIKELVFPKGYNYDLDV